MSPGSHLLASWLFANSFKLNQRDRRVVTLAGVSPDIDGIGWIIDHANSLLGRSSDYFFQYHHFIAHNFLACLITSLLAYYLAIEKKRLIFWLSLIVIHIHFLCDLVGSKGPDGYQWPIHYLWPFNSDYELVWSGQWELDAWQNISITLSMLVIAIFLSWRQNYSFVQVISAWLDREFFKMLARYFPNSRFNQGN